MGIYYCEGCKTNFFNLATKVGHTCGKSEAPKPKIVPPMPPAAAPSITIGPVNTGIKHDQDKPDMSLLSSIALTEVAKVMTFGKRKYSAHNWRGGFVWSRPLAACLRHVFAFLGGEDKDPETGLSHLAHAICCLMFVLEFEKTRPDLDDRYKPKTEGAAKNG